MTSAKEIKEGVLRRPEQYESILTEEDLHNLSEVIKSYNKFNDTLTERLKALTENTKDKTLGFGEMAMCQFILFMENDKDLRNSLLSLGAITTIEKEEIEEQLKRIGETPKSFIRMSLVSQLMENKDFLSFLNSKHK